MSNTTDTDLIQLAKDALPGKIGPLMRWVCVGVEVLILIICTPIFILKREKPDIHFRCWSIQLVTLLAFVLNKVFDAMLCTPTIVTYDNYRQFMVLGSLMLIWVVSALPSIFIRHYFLLQIPILQHRITQMKATNDGNIDKLKGKLRWVKFWSSDLAAWILYLSQVVPLCLILLVIGNRGFDTAAMILNRRNVFDWVRKFSVLVEAVVAIIILLTLLRKKSSDNYRITIQYRVITVGLLLMIIIVSIITWLPREPAVLIIELINDTLFPLFLIGYSLILPIWRSNWEVHRDYLKLLRNASRVSEASRPSPLPSALTSPRLSILASSPTALLGSPSLLSRPSFANRMMSRSELDEILENPRKREELRNFMMKEFCLENLLFVIAVLAYRVEATTVSSPEQLQASAKEVYADYLDARAINQVNVPYDTLQRTKQVIEEMTKDTYDPSSLGTEFDHVDHHVRLLIISDTLRRFKSRMNRTERKPEV